MSSVWYRGGKPEPVIFYPYEPEPVFKVFNRKVRVNLKKLNRNYLEQLVNIDKGCTDIIIDSDTVEDVYDHSKDNEYVESAVSVGSEEETIDTEDNSDEVTEDDLAKEIEYDLAEEMEDDWAQENWRWFSWGNWR